MLIVLRNHIKLERKISTIIRGERIKVYVFIILLPIILGTLGSLFSFFPLITDDLLNLQQSNEIIFPTNSYNPFDLFSFLTILLTSNFISTYYFLATVSFKNKNYFLIFSEILLILSFSISLFNISPLIIWKFQEKKSKIINSINKKTPIIISMKRENSIMQYKKLSKESLNSNKDFNFIRVVIIGINNIE